jgi:hypothetical protein
MGRPVVHGTQNTIQTEERRGMKIGVVPGAWWRDACRAAGHEPLPLPGPGEITGDPGGGDLHSRIRAGNEVQTLLHANPVDFILDAGGAGLSFVEGPGGISDLKLTHEVLRVPLFSHFTDPLPVMNRHLSWEVMWRSLRSTWWVKLAGDEALARELAHFGIPHARFLAPGVMDGISSATEPGGAAPEFDVGFIGDATDAIFRFHDGGDPGALSRELAEWIERGTYGPGFLELRGEAGHRHEPPSTDDEVLAQVQRAAEYFSTKLRFAAGLCARHRDRLVETLRRTLGERFRLIGQGWPELPEHHVVPAPRTLEEYVSLFRTAAINVSIGDGTNESSISPQYFEITGCGGFLLCPHDPHVARYFDIGRECETFADERELIEKIRYYLARPAERQTIARAGWERTRRHHLLRHRLAEVEALYRAARRPAPEARLPIPEEPTVAASRPRPAIPIDLPTTTLRGGGSSTPARSASEGESVHSASTDLPTAPRNNIPAAPISAGVPGKLMVLLNPGRFTRHYLIDMATSAMQLGISVVLYELEQAWAELRQGRLADAAAFTRTLREQNVRAVISAGPNGFHEWPAAPVGDGRVAPLFEQLGIPHLLWWTDHPQWNNEKMALAPELQPLLRSPNLHHFLKSDIAAREIGDLLGWPHCHGLPVAEHPERLRPAEGVRPRYDVVCVIGSPPRPFPGLAEFARQDDPDAEAIAAVVCAGARTRLAALWNEKAPAEMRAALERFGVDWVEGKRRAPHGAAYRLFTSLEEEHSEACAYLRENPTLYFDALEALWFFGAWQRTFLVTYLSRYFSVGVFGRDWSSVGAGGDAEWVDHERQPEVYAQGRVGLNVSQSGDEEGAAHKPFQMAACGVPIVHIRRRGIEELFEPNREIALFDTPGEAREVIADLLHSEPRRRAMAEAARARLVAEHTWHHRLPRMLELAGVDLSTLTRRPRADAAPPTPIYSQPPREPALAVPGATALP